MIKLSLLTTTFALLLAITGTVGAADTSPTVTTPPTDASQPAEEAPTTQSSGDPTLDFFLAMQQCAPGVYQQKNSLSDTVGPEFLQQTIIGRGDDGCKVILTTPDSRVMYCKLTGDNLQAMRDQHFLKGMMGDSATSPTQDSVNADMIWTQIKTTSCSYTQFDN